MVALEDHTLYAPLRQFVPDRVGRRKVLAGAGLRPLEDLRLDPGCEVVLDDTLALGAGGWFATGVSDNFTEGGAFLNLSYSLHKDITVGGSASYHAYDHNFLENGFDLGAFLTWHADRDWNIEAGVYRDFATNGWYAHLGSDWSVRLSDKTYLGISAGISAVEDYYGRSGLNDFHGQASLTYNINTMLSVTPFAGWSCELNNGDGSEIYGGLWFEVSF